MAPAEAGRFCAHCQKTVVDFSGLTDQQIADVLTQRTGSACGRFRQSQLNRSLYVTTPRAQSSRTILGVVAAGLLGYQTTQAEAIPTVAAPADVQINPENSVSTLAYTDAPVSADSLRVITGRVIDQANVSLLGVGVYVKGTSVSVNTDAEGYFRLRIPAEDKAVTLSVGYIGYQFYERQVAPDQQNPITIQLKEDTTALGEVIITGNYKKLTFFQRLRNRFRATH